LGIIEDADKAPGAGEHADMGMEVAQGVVRLGRVGGRRRIVGWVWCGFVGSGHGVDAVTARG
jgi:hypothetical protein